MSVALQPLQHPRAPPLLVATSHLESPLGAQAGKHMAQEREQQVALALPHLQQLAAAAAALAQPHRLGGQQQQQQRQQQQPMDILWGGVSALSGCPARRHACLEAAPALRVLSSRCS